MGFIGSFDTTPKFHVHENVLCSYQKSKKLEEPSESHESRSPSFCKAEAEINDKPEAELNDK